MEDESPSTTALITARMRWIHSTKDPKPILQDTWGGKFSPASGLVSSGYVDESMEESSIDDLLRASPAYANVIVRSWYTENALQTAMEAGTRQYVLIGAGFDSYAYRRPRGAESLEVYEIDHPATQGLKIERLKSCNVPAHLMPHFVSADLGDESLESALSRSSFDPGKPAFLSWLGVTMYLSREANMSTLQSIARYCAPGSELIFSYIDQAVFEGASSGDTQDMVELKQTVSSVGEPFVSGFHPDKLEGELDAVGLDLVEDIDDVAIIQMCDPADVNRLKSTAISRLARARVKG